MSNIFLIQNDLLSIFDELEENGGELTPELEEKLNITKEEFKDKIQSYTNVIKSLNIDIEAIKAEQKRLKELEERKEKVIDKLKTILVNAVNEFGDTKKSGVKYIGFETGEISIRKSKAVDINSELLYKITDSVCTYLMYNKVNNQLDVIDKVDEDNLVEYLDKNDCIISKDDLAPVNISFGLTVPMKDILSGNGYNAIKEIIKYTDSFKVSSSVSKTDLKSKLEENGSCTPNLAKLVINENLTIK